MPTRLYAWFSARNALLALSLLAAGGCSQRPPVSACGPVAYQLSDPAEPANRAVFAFNRSVDDYLLAPVARGYSALPDFTQQGVHNFVANFGEPKVYLNDLLQGNPKRSVNTLGRFAVNSTVGVLGLTFKPNTDDMRDAPSLAIAQTLVDAGVEVTAYDPEGMELARPMMPEVEMKGDAYSANTGADAVVIVTEWDAFRALDLERIKQIARRPLLIDLRNVYDPAEVRSAGFEYVSVGRP